MRAALVVALLLTLAACGSEGGGSRADDPTGEPGSPDSSAVAVPTGIPAATGPVTTRGLATVMDTGRPELCLGAVAESYPPQCRGIPLRGWDWAARHGVFERSGDTRWGLFLVTGTFDGTALTVRGAIPAALYDPAAPAPTRVPKGGDADPAELERIQRELARLPDVLTLGVEDRYVAADVVYDDGSLQAWADRTYGAGNVVVTSALVPSER